GQTRELGPGESRIFGVEAAPEKKESRPVFSGVVLGTVTAKGDAHVLVSVSRVVSSRKDSPPELASSIPGRTLKVSVANAKRKDGEGKKKPEGKKGDGDKGNFPKEIEGERKAREKKEGGDGDAPRKEGPKDGDAPTKKGFGDGEGPRKEGPKDGEGKKKGGEKDDDKEDE